MAILPDMKSVTLKILKEELADRPAKELLEICLRLSKFKKENKELLTYLLFESYDEPAYIVGIRKEMDEQFAQINKKTPYLIKKQIRKILTLAKRQIKYSQKKETEVEVLIYFCQKLKHFTPPIQRNAKLLNMYNVQVEYIRKKIKLLHEDLQFDFGIELENL
jgi:hypothetical protein